MKDILSTGQDGAEDQESVTIFSLNPLEFTTHQ